MTLTSDQSIEIYRKRINLAVDRIGTSLSQPIDLTQLANEVGFSPFHFSRIFAAVMGETPMKYALRLRLEHAANLLIKGTNSLTRIAMDSGFSSLSTFTRAFTRYYQCSPSEYRRSKAYHTPVRIQDERLREPVFILRNTQIQTLPDQPVIYTATYFGYTQNAICDAWNRLRNWAALHNLITPDTSALGISLDDPFITRIDRCRYYACLTTSREITPTRFFDRMTVPGGKYAVFDVTCPVSEIKHVFQHIFANWLIKSGYQPGYGYTYERYYYPMEQNLEKPLDLQIYIPIEPIMM